MMQVHPNSLVGVVGGRKLTCDDLRVKVDQDYVAGVAEMLSHPCNLADFDIEARLLSCFTPRRFLQALSGTHLAPWNSPEPPSRFVSPLDQEQLFVVHENNADTDKRAVNHDRRRDA